MAELRRRRGDVGPPTKFPLGPTPVYPEMPFNPFINHSTSLMDPWEIGKAFLMAPIVLARMTIFASAFVAAWIVANITLLGAKDIFTKPFPKWRRNLLWPLSFWTRAVLFSCGYNWIHIRGKPAKREVAPILVCNHVTSIDPLYLFMAHLPMIVTAKENLDIPVAGVVMKALQVVTVDRTSPTSRKDAAGDIKRRAMCNDWPQVALFPEATTTNGRALVSFKTGAFLPGLPVQPVVIRYPHTSFDPSWVADGMDTVMLVFRMMCCLNNRMVVTYLDPLFPTEREQKDPRLFAERCRMVMARALNVGLTEHAYGDVALALESQKLKVPKGSINLEFGLWERLYKLDLPEAKQMLRRYCELGAKQSRVVTYHMFLEALDLPDAAFTRMAFNVFDVHERGSIFFREFVAGCLFVTRHAQFDDSVKSVFDTLDVDGDGRINAEDARAGLAKLFPGVSAEQRDHLFKAFGFGKKSDQSLEEFHVFLKSHPEYLILALSSKACL